MIAATMPKPDALAIVTRQSELKPVDAAEYLLGLSDTDWPGLRHELTVALAGIIHRSRLGQGGVLRTAGVVAS